MSLLNLGEPSPAWPYIKAVAKYLKIPGTEIGLEPLTDLQDDLAQDQYQDQVKALLEAMRDNTAQVLQVLREKAQMQLQEQELRAAAEDLAEWLYLKRTANKFHFADFKGIQESKFVPLPLDDIFVDLKATPEERETLRLDKERDLRAKLGEADESQRAELLTALEEADANRELKPVGDQARTPGQMLKDPGPVVLLGGPGSGKTTLIKRLARSCALGQTKLRERLPDLAWCFPVVLPITQYVDQAGARTILEYVEHLMRERGGDSLVARYQEHFRNGRVLLLLDGLDEVADTGQRIAAAKAVDEAAQGLDKNRLLATSRRVGYAICRLAVPAAHYVLLPFSPKDITTFAEHWYIALEKSQKQDKADLAAARQTAKELNDEIGSNSSVASLATNPLMLTIIALIKHRSVELPHRRVEFYRIALETLLESWNLARSLAQTRHQRPAGETPRIEQTREVWSHVAYWMHSEANREVRRDRLHEKLVEVLVDECDKSEFDAQAIAGSYLDTAAETSGLLEARGANTFAFVHQSFQEYLAGYRLVRPASRALSRIKEHCHDPRWHEVIRLGVGHLSIVVGEKDVVAEIINALLNATDPLEPYLCTALRLALGCLADQVGLRQQQIDAILCVTAEKLRTTERDEIRTSLLEALEPVESPPGPTAQGGLLQLSTHPAWRVRMESIRLIALASRLNPETLESLQAVFEKDADGDVKAWAAFGLWRQGRKTHRVATMIASGGASMFTRMAKPPGDDFRSVLVKLLEDPNVEVRGRAAEMLGQWGSQENALSALVKLLEDPDAGVRGQATETLGQWGRQEQALPALVKLLGAPNASVRMRAAVTLGQWGRQEKALPALVKLLGAPNASVRLRAAVTLGQWGRQEKALSALVKLLEDPNASVRMRAAVTLGQWGRQEKALPALVKLLEDPNAEVRMRAAATLGQWGPEEKALPVLVKQLEDPNAEVRMRAAATLGKWGPEEKALPVLVKQLEDPNAEVRSGAAATLGRWGPQEKALPALVKQLEDPDAEVRLGAAATLGRWRRQEKALPVLVKLLEDPDAVVCWRAAATLGQWGQAERAAGTTLVAEWLLRELKADSLPTLLAAFQSARRAKNGFGALEVRHELADLLAPQGQENPRQEALRHALFMHVWHYCATTA